MGKTKISWCTDVWNPVRGCSRVSTGCGGADGGGCYAERQAHRFSGPGQPYEGLTRMTNGGPRWTGKVQLVPELLATPLRWRKPRKIFVNSMSDLFHEDIPNEFIAAVYGVMAACPQHTFQVLTKRPQRMLEWYGWLDVFRTVNGGMMEALCGFTHEIMAGRAPGWRPITEAAWPLPNVHLYVSAENQATADERIPLLLQVPAVVRGVSLEPLLEPADISRWLRRMVVRGNEELTDCMVDVGWSHPHGQGDHPGLDHVIIGGESGPHARPCRVEWIRNILRQCKEATASRGVPVFVKQLGSAPEYHDVYEMGDSTFFDFDANGYDANDLPMVVRPRQRAGADPLEWPVDLRVQEMPR